MKLSPIALLVFLLGLAGTGVYWLWQGLPHKASDLTGVWEGSYDCGHGDTLLRLTLKGNDGGRVAGDLAFSGGATHPQVPDGRFTVSGAYDPKSRRLRLYGGEWLAEPAGGWPKVGLTGTVDWRDHLIRGTAQGPGCGGFVVGRR